jgi:hypothetical protein
MVFARDTRQERMFLAFNPIPVKLLFLRVSRAVTRRCPAGVPLLRRICVSILGIAGSVKRIFDGVDPRSHLRIRGGLQDPVVQPTRHLENKVQVGRVDGVEFGVVLWLGSKCRKGGDSSQYLYRLRTLATLGAYVPSSCTTKSIFGSNVKLCSMFPPI